MDGKNGNKVGAVLCVEVIEVRNVLEVVSIDFSAFYYVVRLHIVGEFLDCKSDVLFCKDFLSYCENFFVR